jgi:hypothetical protein
VSADEAGRLGLLDSKQPFLTALDRLALHGTDVLTNWLEMCVNLRDLTVVDCLQRPLDVSAITTCRDLRRLTIRACSVTDVSALGNCAMLEHITLQGCSQIHEIGLEKCTRLKELVLSGSNHLRWISTLPRSLCTLNLGGCNQLDVSCLDELTLPSLETLLLNGCKQVTDCAKFRSCTALSVLNLSYTRLRNISELATLSQLRWLSLSGLNNLRDVTALGQCVSLEHLNLSSCYQLHEVPSLEHCVRLLDLDLHACNQLQRLPALPGSLESLNLRRCSELLDISALTLCGSLQTLDLIYCGQLFDVTPLGAPPVCHSLRTIRLSECINLDCIAALAHCTHLTTLCLNMCIRLQDVSPLGSCKALDDLVSYSPSLAYPTYPSGSDSSRSRACPNFVSISLLLTVLTIAS